MRTYLITGGAGFIGSHLVDALINADHRVIVIDDFSTGTYIHPEAITIRENILNIRKIRSYFTNIDGCFHLAAIPSVIMTMKSWFHYHSVNLKGSLNVFKLAVEGGNIPLVYASSCAVYGEAGELPLHEGMQNKPLSSYACDKLSCEHNAYFLSKNYGLPTLSLRFFNVYGPRQNPASPYSGVICNFISRMLEGNAPIIFGNGEQTRDFIFVADVVKNLIRAMELVNSEGEVVNICMGKPTSIKQLADQISRLMGKKIQPDYQDKRMADVLNSYGSKDKMKSLGFSADTDLVSGLQKTIQFMRSAPQ